MSNHAQTHVKDMSKRAMSVKECQHIWKITLETHFGKVFSRHHPIHRSLKPCLRFLAGSISCRSFHMVASSCVTSLHKDLMQPETLWRQSCIYRTTEYVSSTIYTFSYLVLLCSHVFTVITTGSLFFKPQAAWCVICAPHTRVCNIPIDHLLPCWCRGCW